MQVSISQLTLAGNNVRNPPPPDGEPACYYDYGHAVFIQSTAAHDVRDFAD
jgi:hypothetical protein